ncbi:T9SS type A sorting domain-containing protein [Saprospiraceae bacterium]|nr:T9SS type A sorting domain-containing protein [Saprospiraceae bacterium]
MRIVFLISFGIMLLSNISFAQCGTDEVEVKVNINTDPYGGETSWTLTDLTGAIILQGGQGNVYENNTSYSDSTCVSAEGCFFFEIYDTYGDGIFAPDGFELYVDEILNASGSDDIDDYALEIVLCNNACEMVQTALNDLQGHIKGSTILTSNELLLVGNTFNQFPECLAENEEMILLGKSVIEDFDLIVGPLFTTSNTVNGFSKDPLAAPAYDVERAMVFLEQAIFDYVFTANVYLDHAQHINNWVFNSSAVFPGSVEAPSDSSSSKSVLIRANFADPDGTNPYLEINNDNTDHALRPTGLYLAPGSVATVTVPDSLVGQNYFVRIGSHEWDLGIRPIYRRIDRISKKFLIESNTIEVFNPFGGAISILVPHGADDGIVEVSVNNGVECPFFSLKSFDETVDFNAELNKPGPWVVFETDNVMFTIPSHSIVPGEYDIKQAMRDWDTALQGVNSIMAREIVSDKHNMYMISDITIRHNVYSIGYPMSNTPQRYTDVPGPTYFLNGPGPDDEVNFHESGHALAMSKFPGEVEALVNFPYVMALNYGLGQDLNEAVNYSFVPNTFDVDRTATHRMVSNSFGFERDIANSTTNEVRYQHRGYGHYFEIVNMLGWCPLRNFWKQEYIDSENGLNFGINNQDIDLRTIRMSVAAQADLRPLFHVFGILPQDTDLMQDTLDQLGIQPSVAIYNRLQAYFDLIPDDNEAFVDYALLVYPNLYDNGPTDNPDYGVGWHYQKSLTYDAAEAQERIDILQSIVDLYFPNGAPTENDIVDVCCMLDTININKIDEEVIVTGGVEPYDISIEVTGNVETVTVIDFDGCESTVQYTVSSLLQENEQTLKIFPNPASTQIYIDLTEGNKQIANLQVVSINGQVIQKYNNATSIIDISDLSEGLYILQIILTSGEQINNRVVVLR